MSTWQQWLEEQQQRSNMQVRPVPLNETPGWKNRGVEVVKDGGGFFTVEGCMVSRGETHWGQPLLVQVADPGDPEGRCGIVCLLADETGAILLQAEPEPGAKGPGKICLRAAIQTSHSRLASGKVPFKDLLANRAHLGNAETDANRMVGSVEYAHLAVKREDVDLSDKPNFRWFTQDELAEAQDELAPLNGHLWIALGMYFNVGG